jgi:hypothetical protein
MSNHLAVATVTAALGQVVHTAAQSAVGGVTLRFGRPVAQGTGTAERRVHVYLYQVTPHAAMRNADLPTRSSDGRTTQRPQAALELHYLLSFYGDDQLLEADRMLAAVVRDMHARPLLTAQNIADAIAGHSSELDGSDLAAAVDRVRFTPETLTLDEQSKLWSVMVQTPYALSVVYVARAVLLDSVESATPGPPVLRRGSRDEGVNTTVGPFPRLEDTWIGFPDSVHRQPRLPSLRAAPLGSRILISGSNLGGDAVTLRFKHPLLPEQSIAIPPADRDADQLRLTLPDDAPAQGQWAAGLYGLTAVVQRGAAFTKSPLWPLLLAPRVSAIAPNPAASAGGTVTLTLTCRPQVQPEQAATLLIAGREVQAETHAAATDTLKFVLDPAPIGADQLVWLRVDGAQSMPVALDPVSGVFMYDAAQKVSIT